MSKFRESRSFRAKTDEIDAECLYVFGTKHAEELRPWSPLPKDVEALRTVLKQYHKLTQQRVRLIQIMRKSCLDEFDAALGALTALLDRLEKDTIAAAKRVDEGYYNRLLAAPGFGTYSACAFTYLFKGREFESPDAARAFIGMDLKVRDSGKKKRERCLTKCGDSMLRHAAGCAGRGLLNSKYGREKNLELKAHRRESPARMMIAGAKLVRIAFALHTTGQPFDPKKFRWKLDTKT
jgi:transposase